VRPSSKDITFSNGGTRFTCNHCKVSGGPYQTAVVCRRVASIHLVKKHPDMFKPKPKYVPKSKRVIAPVVASLVAEPEKRPYVRKPVTSLGLNYCPACGCKLNAIRVALSL